MGKKRSWFTFAKRLFISDAKAKTEKKSKRWGWMFGRFKFRQYPEIAAEQKTLSEATEVQRKHVLAAAMATAAAAVAAVAAANAAAEVVWLAQAPSELGKQSRYLAAIRIQSVYRRHLARKALYAMKGFVKLQAVIRGEIARRRMITKLKFIQSLAMTRSQVYKLRVATADENRYASEKRQIFMPKEMKRFQDIEELGTQLGSEGRVGDIAVKEARSYHQKGASEEILIFHRERRNNQIPQVAVNNEKDRQISQIYQLAEAETHRKQATDKFNSFVHPKIIAEDANHVVPLKLRNTCDQDSVGGGGLDSPVSRPRRSFGDIKQKSIGDDSSLPNSPIFPTYMAAAQSAKAKARSFSTPKQRVTLSDSCSSQNSPYKLRLSSWSSFNGEMISIARKSGILQQRHADSGGLYRE